MRNIVAGQALYDPWQVNQGAECHEAGERAAESSSTSGLRAVTQGPSITGNGLSVPIGVRFSSWGEMYGRRLSQR